MLGSKLEGSIDEVQIRDATQVGLSTGVMVFKRKQKKDKKKNE